MKINGMDLGALVLTIVGGLNWGLVGALDFNLVDTLFGEESALSRIVYVLVGVSALYLIYTTTKLLNSGEHTA